MAVQFEFLNSIPYFLELNLAELDSVRELFFEKMAEREFGLPTNPRGSIISSNGEGLSAYQVNPRVGI